MRLWVVTVSQPDQYRWRILITGYEMMRWKDGVHFLVLYYTRWEESELLVGVQATHGGIPVT